VLLLPVRDLLALSPRADRTVDFALAGESYYVAVLTGLLAPLRGTYAIHCGLLAPLLALIALVLRPGRDRGAPIFFALGGAFFLLCALGAQTPLLRWLVVHLPGFGLFRSSTRYLVAFPLFWGVLAAHGMTVLLDPRSRLIASTTIIAVLAVVVLAATQWAKRAEPQLVFSDGFPWAPLGPSLLLGGFALAIVLAPRRWVGTVVPAGLLVFFVWQLHVVRRGLGYEPRPDHLEDLAKIGKLPDLASFRVYDEFLLEQRAGSRLGLREFRGYPSQDPLARTDYIEILSLASTASGLPILGEYNIRYVLYGPHSTKGWGRRRLAGAPDEIAPKRFSKIAPGIYEQRFVAPHLAWYGGVQRVAPGAVLSTLRAARDDKGVRRVAVLAEGTIPAALEPRIAPLRAPPASPPPAVPGRITRFGTDRIDAEIEAPGPGVVVLNEFMYPGWRVFVDGAEAQPLTVDLCLRGVLVGAGRHQLRWQYRPVHWTLLLSAWLLGIATMAWAAVDTLRDARRARHPNARGAGQVTA
jgi:hypothetical protein